MAGAMILVTANSTITYILIFFAELSLNLNWAIVADILLVSKNLIKIDVISPVF